LQALSSVFDQIDPIHPKQSLKQVNDSLSMGHQVEEVTPSQEISQREESKLEAKENQVRPDVRSKMD